MENDPNTSFVLSSDQRKSTIGDFVRALLEEKQYLGQIMLPRIPILVNREIQAKLHILDERRKLKALNEQRNV